MLAALKAEMNKTYTENGAATHSTSGSDCLDLFATVGGLRRAEEEEIRTRFLRAFAEDRRTALRIAFFARDVRGGLGERRVFRVMLKELSRLAPESVKKNIAHIPEYGRWDDLLALFGTSCEAAAVECIAAQLAVDEAALAEEGKSVSLLAKWLPSANASSSRTVYLGKQLAHALGLREEEYRKKLVALRRRIRIIENDLREKNYTFDYEKQPSRALFRYRAAFRRHDRERYWAFLGRAVKGQAVLHAGTIYPYDLVEPFVDESCRGQTIPAEDLETIEATWRALPDYAGDEDALVVVDGSGSMYWGEQPRPISVAVSLGLYFAERNRGAFRGHFITFSARPQLVCVKGETFADKVRYALSFMEVAYTNIESVFRLILETAVRNHLPQSEMPKSLYFISDMEFDACTEDAELTNFENAKAMFEKAGYELPHVAFWNVASRNRQQPVTQNEAGVALLSGRSPILFKRAMSGEASPFTYMMEVLESERYRGIEA